MCDTEPAHHTKRGISMEKSSSRVAGEGPYLNLSFLALAANGSELAHHSPVKQKSWVQTKPGRHICPVSVVWARILLVRMHRHDGLHAHRQSHLVKLRRYLSAHYAPSSNHVDSQ